LVPNGDTDLTRRKNRFEEPFVVPVDAGRLKRWETPGEYSLDIMPHG